MTEEYENYLQNSTNWKALKQRTRERDKYTCQLCGQCFADEEWKLHPHHLTYTRVYHEHDDDIVTLCSDCHHELHEAVESIQSKLLDIMLHEKQDVQTAVEPVRFRYAIKRERLLVELAEEMGLNRPASARMLSILNSTMMERIRGTDVTVHYGLGRESGFYSTMLWAIRHGKNKKRNTIKTLNTKVVSMYEELLRKRNATDYENRNEDSY